MSTVRCPRFLPGSLTAEAISPATCGLCGQTGARRVRSLVFPGHPGPFHLWRCRRCGLVFNWPRLAAEPMKRQYDGDYYVFNARPEHRWSRATQLYLNYLAPLESCQRSGRLLEIGCAQGHLLALASHRGWQAEGVEISAEAARVARSEFGLSVHTGSLEGLGDELGRFEVAIATDVIEHVPDPRGFLQAIRGRLLPGGLAIIETPNWGGVWRRLGGRRWLGLNRFHISLFDGACLTRLMRECDLMPTAVFSTMNTVCSDWGGRPELTRFLSLLPRGLRWRVQGRLSRMTPQSAEHHLEQNPPASLSAALDRIALLKEVPLGQPGPHPGGTPFTADFWLSGDNLAVIGRAVSC
ncbi:MAG TPA: class I SAM-dependent methyltransferase [Phycisphaerae bacterium]|nr:class I SAM-dependent methyltransferase [Phycisphaerae bacterium]HRY67900.1 class I SAM-dependent methyltransferase [Phycisphaerae bacterium]HSA26059.1 class I SAM-dependent methyltransferase [Phycisphaerae bacterium]